MKIAIMQPYIFPYIGYFQLINVVDTFVVYDDVNFIKQGWINRNSIIAGGGSLLFTVPLEHASSNKLINCIKLDSRSYPIWRTKFLQTLEQNYKKAPFFKRVFPGVKQVFELETISLTDLLFEGILFVSNYLAIKTKFVKTSTIYTNNHLKGQQRVVDICKKENADQYYNLIGGQHLYNKSEFLNASIRLNFIQPKKDIEYQQAKNTNFISRLSIIDVLMYVSPEDISIYLTNYEIS